MAPHSSTLAWKIPWMEEPGGLQSMGLRRVGHDWATSLSPFTSCTGEGNGYPLQYSCLENPRDRGAWWAAVYEVAQSQTWLTWLNSIRLTWGFPISSVGKESICNAGDPGLIPGLRRSPGEGTGCPLQHSRAPLVAQSVKNWPAMQEIWVQSLGWEDLLEEGMTTHCSIPGLPLRLSW